MYGGFMEDVWRIYRGFIEYVWMIYERFMEGFMED
jgi:hypothetical protein